MTNEEKDLEEENIFMQFSEKLTQDLGTSTKDSGCYFLLVLVKPATETEAEEVKNHVRITGSINPLFWEGTFDSCKEIVKTQLIKFYESNNDKLLQ